MRSSTAVESTSSQDSDFVDDDDEDSKIATLFASGFDGEDIEVALRESNNDITKACELLSSSAQASEEVSEGGTIVKDDSDAGPSSDIFPTPSFKCVRRVANTEDCTIFANSSAVMRCVEAAKSLLATGVSDPVCTEFVDVYLPKCILLHVSPPEPMHFNDTNLGLSVNFCREVVPLIAKRNRSFDSEKSYCDHRKTTSGKEHTHRLLQELIDLFISSSGLFFINNIIKENQSTLLPKDVAALVDGIETFRDFVDGTKLHLVLHSIANGSLRIVDEIPDKLVRDALCRAHVIDTIDKCSKWIEFLEEDPGVCNRCRLKFFLRCITCNQLDAKVFAFHELGKFIAKLNINPNILEVDLLNTWLRDNNILKHALQGNMDQPTYLEKIQPVISYMTSEMSANDLANIWSLRNGRMGVSADNFSTILVLIGRMCNIEQLGWLEQMFIKCFHANETRMYDRVFLCCKDIAIQSEIPSMSGKMLAIMWNLIEIVRGKSFATTNAIKWFTEVILDKKDLTYKDMYIKKSLECLSADSFIVQDLSRLEANLDEVKGYLRDMNLAKILYEKLSTCKEMATKNPQRSSSLTAVELSEGCNYSFIVKNLLAVLKWLITNQVVIFSNDTANALWNTLTSGGSSSEASLLFDWLSEFSVSSMMSSTLTTFLYNFCNLPAASITLDALKCLCHLLHSCEYHQLRGQVGRRCMDYMWEVLEVSENNEVADEIMQRLIEFGSYEKDRLHCGIKSGDPQREKSDDNGDNEEDMQEAENSQDSVPCDEPSSSSTPPIGELSSQHILRRIHRLLQLIAIFVESEDNLFFMSRQYPPHGTLVPGRPLRISCRMEDDPITESTLVLRTNSHESIGQFRSRLSNRLHFMFLMLHTLLQITDTKVQQSCRRILSLIPVDPAVLAALNIEDPSKRGHEKLNETVLINDFLTTDSPYMLLYTLEVMAGLLVPTCATRNSVAISNRLARAILHSNVYHHLLKLLAAPHMIAPLIQPTDRTRIFELLTLIFGVLLLGQSVLSSAITNDGQCLSDLQKCKNSDRRKDPLYEDLSTLTIESSSLIANLTAEEFNTLITTIRDAIWLCAAGWMVYSIRLPIYDNYFGTLPRYGNNDAVREAQSKSAEWIERTELKVPDAPSASLSIRSDHAEDDSIGRLVSNALELHLCVASVLDVTRSISDDVFEIWRLIGRDPVKVASQIFDLICALGANSNYGCINADFLCGKLCVLKSILGYTDEKNREELGREYMNSVLSRCIFSPVDREWAGPWESKNAMLALEILADLSEGVPQNSVCLTQFLKNYFGESRDLEWEFRPLRESRVLNHVGLQNAGGTCYMNSVLQQIFAIPGLAEQLFSFDFEDGGNDENSQLLVALQSVFTRLAKAQARLYVPREMWDTFRFYGADKLDTRQQHDAVDFFTELIDRVDSALEAQKKPLLFRPRLGGKFNYEYICYGCFHRHDGADEEFLAINLELQGTSLEDCLEHYVRDEILEGDNAYVCSVCKEKRSTLRRGSFCELPNTLAIQLKRFSYDISGRVDKKNDFCSFPMLLDMAPYCTEARAVTDRELKSLFNDVIIIIHITQILRHMWCRG
ncbi:unnamed protein product [Nippostrongylus brasiliensis]|uniref:Ubiquitin carboxyl-terminal hydrolase 24 (inferred by orthology to a human protein) n=1 Tax=Nippostrongylus brasiliensis TaxID=27835 RepID=A0A158R2W2_NIPBR|nr:unnamed protein product [Nippostrongylus brasiliensis]